MLQSRELCRLLVNLMTMFRLICFGLAVFVLASPDFARAQTADLESGRSVFVPRLKFELIDKKFAIGGFEGDAAHEARFKITVTTGGMRAGDGTFGEKMVGFRVPIPQIIKGGAGLFGVAGDNSEGAPRVIMTQPLTDENGVALGKVVSGMRMDTVRLSYDGATLSKEEMEIESAWNELDDSESWTEQRVRALGKAHDVTYRMSFERAGEQVPIGGHKMEFGTSGMAGRLWRHDYGPDLDGDGQPDGEYIYANFVLPDSEQSALAGTLLPADIARFTRWQPRVTRGTNGVYTATLTPRFDSRFVVDALLTELADTNAYGAEGGLYTENSPRVLQPRTLQLEKSGPVAPAVWDRASVARLLRDIEKPRSAALLRGLYFGAHQAHALSVDAGWKLLTEATNAAKPQSRRWFLLMSLRGFAGLRTENVPPEQGFAAYRALFDSADKAPKARAQTIVRAALADFVNTTPLGFGQYKLFATSGDNAATAAAWNAYSQSQNWSSNSAERADKALWALKWNKVGITNDLARDIARQSETMKNAPLDWRFAAASALSSGGQQAAAFVLWSKIKTELGKNDLDHLNIVYESLMQHAQWLSSTRGNPRGGKALKPSMTTKKAEVLRRNLAQERTQRWGFGWAERLEMAPDGARMRIARQLLARPHDKMMEDEIMRATHSMFARAFEDESESSVNRGAANAMGVLARGLLARPDLPRERQWKARLLLASLLERLSRRSEAAEVLAPPFGTPANEDETELLERVQNARRALGN